ncbi:DUF2345 domain-containing protein, partial [Pseudomonas lundensis]|uniref:DUF2345 domain-containing protein n=1 Tax=Pseudomonas lundensis TaxID=86185 RepID=UPI00147330B0
AINIQAQNDKLQLMARHGLDITSTEDEIRITAKKKITLNAGGSYITLDPSRIESGTVGDYNVKAAHYEYTEDKATLSPRIPVLPALIDPPRLFNEQFQIFRRGGEQIWPGIRYKITSESGQVWKGTTDSQGLTERVHTATAEKLSLSYDFEEEEEEGITLRIGLFFDGTGNNLSNAAATAQCQREDLKLFDQSELAMIFETCKAYGYDQFDGEGFAVTPDNSYGNAASNVVHLFGLYPDNTATPLTPEAEIGYVKVYIEGIGTRSGGEDDVIVGMGMGQGETGVVARVEQTPAAIMEKLRDFTASNPGTSIGRIEFDIFGFSRGAAAAHHCANELIKPGRGHFGEVLQGGQFGLLDSFDPAVDISINLIGVFDTVAAIGTIERGDLSVGNDINHGVNMYLPPGCARKVIQLRARDECCNNFSLNSVQPDHQQICLPGVHSDVGGGYVSRARERVWLIKPVVVTVLGGRPVETSPEWHRAQALAHVLIDSGLAGDGRIDVITWTDIGPAFDKDSTGRKTHLVGITLDRTVRGELALIALRVMRELGVRNGVPFDVLDDEDRRFKLPEELKPIAAEILEQALVGLDIKLNPDQERLLRGRYIHHSANWIPQSGLFVNKPTSDGVRNIYPNHPHKGYPE